MPEATGFVDAHHHVWSLTRGDYAWLTPELAPIYRDFTLADLEPLNEAAGVTATVLVQAAPTVAETQFLLKVAKGSGGVVKGVVPFLTLSNANAAGSGWKHNFRNSCRARFSRSSANANNFW